jgi:hypothetical protein
MATIKRNRYRKKVGGPGQIRANERSPSDLKSKTEIDGRPHSAGINPAEAHAGTRKGIVSTTTKRMAVKPVAALGPPTGAEPLPVRSAPRKVERTEPTKQLAIRPAAPADLLYEEARKALEACTRIDEVKDFRDKVRALETYARRAQDYSLEKKASETRLRYERRAGQMLRDMAERGERATRGDSDGSNLPNVASPDVSDTPTLSDLGISRDESSRWQRLAVVSDEIFERALNRTIATSGRATTAAMLREVDRANSKRTQADTLPARAETSENEAAVRSYALAELHELRRELRRLSAEAGAFAAFLASDQESLPVADAEQLEPTLARLTNELSNNNVLSIETLDRFLDSLIPPAPAGGDEVPDAVLFARWRDQIRKVARAWIRDQGLRPSEGPLRKQ